MTQTVVSTGASAGIVRATAGLYGAQGASAGLIARGTDRPHGAAEDVIEAGQPGPPHPVPPGRVSPDRGWPLPDGWSWLAAPQRHPGPAHRPGRAQPGEERKHGDYSAHSGQTLSTAAARCRGGQRAGDTRRGGG